MKPSVFLSFAVVVLLVIVTMAFVGSNLKTLYDFKAKTIDGKDFDFNTLRGKKVMIVNTASKCGFTPQYEKLELLYKSYKDKNFTIVGFPSNDFGQQEPGTNAEIMDFCTKNYGVSFQMMEKITVKGESIHPLYKWLTTKEQNGLSDEEVKWNFQKFLIDEKGNLVKVIGHRESPNSEEIVKWIEGK